jgi:hypothetical protein
VSGATRDPEPIGEFVRKSAEAVPLVATAATASQVYDGEDFTANCQADRA